MKSKARASGLFVAALLVMGACKGGTVTTRAAPTTDPNKLVRLLSVRALPSSIGAFVVGEVKNQSSKPVQSVKINVKIKAIARTQPIEEFGFTLIDVLHPGTTAPFSIPVTVEGIRVESVEASLEAAEAPADEKVALAIPAKRNRNNGPLYEVTGSIRNNHSIKVTAPKVAATFYNARGRVVGAAVAHLDPLVLGPGETAPFTLTLNERPKEVARYKLISEATAGEVEGVKPLPDVPAPEEPAAPEAPAGATPPSSPEPAGPSTVPVAGSGARRAA